MELNDIEDLLGQIPDQDGYETDAFLQDLESAVAFLLGGGGRRGEEGSALEKAARKVVRAWDNFGGGDRFLHPALDELRDALNDLEETKPVSVRDDLGPVSIREELDRR